MRLAPSRFLLARRVSFNLLRTGTCLWVVAAALIAAGCSEDPAPPSVTTEPPQVRVLYPPANIDAPFIVSDSTDIYLGAFDAEGVREVQFFFRRPQDAGPQLVGTSGSAIDPGTVPDSIAQYLQLPANWSLYTVRWRTQTIGSGTLPQIFARATGTSGLFAVSPPSTVKILNRGEDLHPPDAEFVIIPDRGTINTVFTFDPTNTVDQIDSDDRVQVRWDFDGDTTTVSGNGWSIPWDSLKTAADIITHKYDSPGIFTVRMQARNTYIEGVGQRERDLPVEDEGGNPHPPQPANYVELPNSHVYPFGLPDSAAVANGSADSDEVPANRVRFRQSIRIEITEVTNALYLDYLTAAIAAGRVVYRDNLVLSSGTPPTRYMEMINSRIFYDVDSQRFRIQTGFDDHPVTGVTWFGARDYCRYYGLRLPYEAEWEAAARGDSANWNYPFGRTQFEGDPSGKARMNFTNSGDPFGTTSPVGFYNGQALQGFQTIDSPTAGGPPGSNGCYDMSGNVAEWVNDWYGPYPSRTGVIDNPQGPQRGVFKGIRGGSWQDGPRRLRVTDRSGDLPDASYPSVGFRTAYSVILPPP